MSRTNSRREVSRYSRRSEGYRGGEYVLVGATEDGHRVGAGVSIVRPDRVCSARTRGDLDVVSHEGLSDAEVGPLHKVGIERGRGYNHVPREAGAGVCRLCVEDVEPRYGSVGELSESAVVPDKADDPSAGCDAREEVLASDDVIDPSWRGPGVPAVRGSGKHDVAVPRLVIVPDYIDTVTVGGKLGDCEGSEGVAG